MRAFASAVQQKVCVKFTQVIKKGCGLSVGRSEFLGRARDVARAGGLCAGAVMGLQNQSPRW